jgi:hypothetical protein
MPTDVISKSIKIPETHLVSAKGRALETRQTIGGYVSSLIEKDVEASQPKRRKKIGAEVSLNGVIAIPKSDTDIFWSKFIEWVEANGYYFGGGHEITPIENK